MTTHLNGPRLAEWLRNVRPFSLTVLVLGDRLVNSLHQWKNRQQVPYCGAVDEILTRLDIPESMIPDELWVAPWPQ